MSENSSETVTVRDIALMMGRTTRSVRYYLERGQLNLTPLPNSDPLQFATAEVVVALAEFIPPRTAGRSAQRTK